LEEHGGVYIPQISDPIYLDRPIVLRSGNRLVVHPETELRLIVGDAGTCLLGNAAIAYSQQQPVDWCAGADTNILIEGGVWSDQANEGRGGRYDRLTPRRPMRANKSADEPNSGALVAGRPNQPLRSNRPGSKSMAAQLLMPARFQSGRMSTTWPVSMARSMPKQVIADFRPSCQPVAMM
jgi:hypothetical protein